MNTTSDHLQTLNFLWITRFVQENILSIYLLDVFGQKTQRSDLIQCKDWCLSISYQTKTKSDKEIVHLWHSAGCCDILTMQLTGAEKQNQ